VGVPSCAIMVDTRVGCGGFPRIEPTFGVHTTPAIHSTCANRARTGRILAERNANKTCCNRICEYNMLQLYNITAG